MLWVQRKIGAALQLFVGTGIAKALAVEHGSVLGYFKTHEHGATLYILYVA